MKIQGAPAWRSVEDTLMTKTLVVDETGEVGAAKFQLADPENWSRLNFFDSNTVTNNVPRGQRDLIPFRHWSLVNSAC